MKVKIFSGGFTDEPTDLQEQLDGWLEQNPKITIVAQSVASTTGTNRIGDVFVNVTIVVWYKE